MPQKQQALPAGQAHRREVINDDGGARADTLLRRCPAKSRAPRYPKLIPAQNNRIWHDARSAAHRCDLEPNGGYVA
jgi:hypothetical protein